MSGSEKPDPRQKTVDPWSITGYLISGMVIYGGVGWLVDRWVGTSNVFAPIGVIFGLAAGLFLTFRALAALEKQERESLVRRKYRPEAAPQDPVSPPDSQNSSDTQHD